MESGGSQHNDPDATVDACKLLLAKYQEDCPSVTQLKKNRLLRILCDVRGQQTNELRERAQ